MSDRWERWMRAAQEQFQGNAYAQAEDYYASAVEEAEGLGDDSRLATSLLA